MTETPDRAERKRTEVVSRRKRAREVKKREGKGKEKRRGGKREGRKGENSLTQLWGTSMF